jgi:protein-S-isoprenylcysteine O-methyltransferase Ste14
VKNVCFLRFLVSWAVGDSSAGSLFIQNDKKSDASQGALKYYPLLLLAGAVTVVPLVWAESQKLWVMAQACLITILLLLALAVWCWWQTRNKTADLSVRAAVYHRAIEKLLWLVAIGLLAMISIASQWKHWEYGIVCRAIGYGILVAGSTFIAGVLLGYLFGLRPTDNSKEAAEPLSKLHPQTNLVEIADWLTKIILGAGLVQLTHLPTPIWKFAQTMAEGVVNGTGTPGKVGEPPNPPMALAIMGFFSTCGLLYGYLWTRYEDAVTSDDSGDASAFALVNRWLNGRIAPDDQTRLDLIDAIKSASSAAKMRIFLQAEQYRRLSTEDVNERSLPVFQALVEADPEGVFHRSRGQYALALMGKKKDPKSADDDWRNALDLLNDAIRTRDSSREPGWHDYEFARAVCEIVLDPNFRKEQPSDGQTAHWIRTDLDQAADLPEAIKNLIDQGQVVGKWEGLAATKAA